jgi:hypothetical protein
MLNAFIRKEVGEITLHEWEEVIEKHPALAPQSDFYRFNPLTGETNWISGEGSAKYIADPESDGLLSLMCGELNVVNVPLTVCEEVAAMLGAKVHEFAEWEDK